MTLLSSKSTLLATSTPASRLTNSLQEFELIYPSTTNYPTGRKFSLEFKLRYFATGKFANLNSTYYDIFMNLSMIAYIVETQNSKFANI